MAVMGYNNIECAAAESTPVPGIDEALDRLNKLREVEGNVRMQHVGAIRQVSKAVAQLADSLEMRM